MIDGLETIDMVEIVRQSGVDLKEYGNKHFGLCPFHEDLKPSFYVYDGRRFKCFGCQEHGDAIDFVRKLHGISFIEALEHLGLHKYKPSKEEKKKIEARKNRQRTIKAFRQWEKAAVDELATLVRCAHKGLREIHTVEDLDRYGDIYHSLVYWENCLDVLCTGDDAEKYQLFMRI